MTSTLFDPDDPLLAKVKQCVMAEYVPVCEYAEESSINVLIDHGDSFEWMDITCAIPANSDRQYVLPDQATVRLLKPRA